MRYEEIASDSVPLDISQEVRNREKLPVLEQTPVNMYFARPFVYQRIYGNLFGLL
jgi:hypothetical protein